MSLCCALWTVRLARSSAKVSSSLRRTCRADTVAPAAFVVQPTRCTHDMKRRSGRFNGPDVTLHTAPRLGAIARFAYGLVLDSVPWKFTFAHGTRAGPRLDGLLGRSHVARRVTCCTHVWLRFVSFGTSNNETQISQQRHAPISLDKCANSLDLISRTQSRKRVREALPNPLRYDICELKSIGPCKSVTMDPYSMSTEQWNSHMEALLDLAMTSSTVNSSTSNVQCEKRESTVSGPPQTTTTKRPRKTDHPMFISKRQCLNRECGGTDEDFLVDANGGSVVCIQCGMIQDTAVLDGAPTFANSDATSSVYVVHRYSRIAYVRGLLKSTEGETKVELTQSEIAAITHYITDHQNGRGGNVHELSRQIKRAVTRMKLRKCLIYHAHTIAYKLYKSHLPPHNETQIRQALRRFRSLENEWDKAPRHGPLRNGTKKFPSVTWMWQKICHELGLTDIVDLFYVPLSQKKCILKREKQYSQLMSLAGHKAGEPHDS